ncbi:hypothetical protein ACH4Y0_19460 [Streptomyces sp. NPDC020707]|uniref:Uncharacterized protein n=1 Tax=Streptomyces ortus TaxID=2867268 RepID=A0ABT3VFS9_9ACTN|nr:MULTISPECIES: hypothetical protein [Streptomyces]MCX4238730.1 hypothetical protein [Streptomyces ortus]
MPPALAGALGSKTRADRPQLSVREENVREENVLIEWFQSQSNRSRRNWSRSVSASRHLRISVRSVNSSLDRVRIKYANVGRPARTKANLVARAIQDGLVDVADL